MGKNQIVLSRLTMAILVVVILIAGLVGYLGATSSRNSSTSDSSFTSDSYTSSASSTTNASTLTSSSKTSYQSIPVGVFWYLWYGYNYPSDTWPGGNGTSHWNDSPVGKVIDKPIVGYYASLNNATIGWQIDEMIQAGITFAIISWWGWGVTNFPIPMV
ncbi:MAG: hypothetical protein ACYCQJ_00730 [Nitrososphaerales archaeon]